jgi:hypothetical protein
MAAKSSTRARVSAGGYPPAYSRKAGCCRTLSGTRLEGAGLSERVAEVNQRAVEMSCETAGSRAYVVGYIGPLGKLLASLGKITYEQAVASFAEQAAELAEAEVASARSVNRLLANPKGKRPKGVQSSPASLTFPGTP